MGLDVYVGSLTRYYAGDWELMAQKAAKEMGLDLQVIRRHDPKDAIRDPEEIRPTVLTWRENLTEALGENLSKPLDWDEGPEAPYFTDKPAWDCYSDLLLWAAYDEQHNLNRPYGSVDQFGIDPAYVASTATSFHSRYSHLYEVELWLPGSFGFVFKTEDVGGNPILIGLSVALARQLKELNKRTWQASDQMIARWRQDGSEHGAPLECGARFAFSVFYQLAEEANVHRLPMRLDY